MIARAIIEKRSFILCHSSLFFECLDITTLLHGLSSVVKELYDALKRIPQHLGRVPLLWVGCCYMRLKEPCNDVVGEMCHVTNAVDS